ncbi:signaling protein [Leptospira bouyouniensis]|uniref:Signaling protein n=1 Tax=Leptospira bouyouniensis TaxID=2484911 RepID=A0ABY2L924_9LEPT|nr:signaling protein [Leptospira bouyouniensis]
MKFISNFFLVIFSILFQLNCYKSLNQLEQNQFYVDLSQIDWENSEPINISYGWKFYWKELLDPVALQTHKSISKVPLVDFRPWTNLTTSKNEFPAQGFATYHKKIKIQISERPIHLVLYFSHLYTASKLFINGELMQEKGVVSASIEKVRPDRTNSTIDIKTNKQELDIVLQIANKDFYHGGPRSEFIISSPSKMSLFKSKSLMVEIFVFGLIFGSALYHMFFYLHNRKQKAFLYFAIVCLTFLVRIPFLNSKLYEYFFPIFSFNLQSILLHYINVITFLFSVLFLKEMFRSNQYKMIRYTFYMGALIALFTPLTPSTIQHYLNFIYLVVCLILFLFFSLFLLIKHKKEAQGLYFMAIALVSLAVFCFLAISLNYYGIQGGLYLIIGYLLYVIFQTVSLSKYFAFVIESRANIEMLLHEESILALSKQRTEMQLMVHDQLGANLTDLKVYLERNMPKPIDTSSDFLNLEYIYQKVNSIIQSLRNQLLYIEDMNLIFENFITGLHLTLLRRYSDVGREFEFSTSEKVIEYFNQTKIIGKNQSYFLNIFYMLYEVCTNDIKYGLGESVWLFDYVNGFFTINQKNMFRKPNIPSPGEIELKSIQQRLEQLNGTFDISISEVYFELKIRFPVERSLNP